MGDPSQVVCRGQGLTFGYYGQAIVSTIDTSKAGPGELTVYCQGPTQRALCELEDNDDGTFTLQVEPQENGRHQLNVMYNRTHVPGSPFTLNVSMAGLIRITGPGLESGMRHSGQDEFVVDLTDVSPGDVTVQIGGPTGKFKLKTFREGRRLICKYGPRKAGEYQIRILWGRDPVPGSPFIVYKADTGEQLQAYQDRNYNQQDNYNSTA